MPPSSIALKDYNQSKPLCGITDPKTVDMFPTTFVDKRGVEHITREDSQWIVDFNAYAEKNAKKCKTPIVITGPWNEKHNAYYMSKLAENKCWSLFINHNFRSTYIKDYSIKKFVKVDSTTPKLIAMYANAISPKIFFDKIDPMNFARENKKTFSIFADSNTLVYYLNKYPCSESNSETKQDQQMVQSAIQRLIFKTSGITTIASPLESIPFINNHSDLVQCRLKISKDLTILKYKLPIDLCLCKYID